MKSELRRYYRTIRSFLPCSHKLKNKILDEIEGSVNHYLEEFPKASFKQIESRFGNPKSIAAAYVDDMDTQEPLSALRIRKKVVIIITICVITALTLWITALGAATIRSSRRVDSYIEVVVENN